MQQLQIDCIGVPKALLPSATQHPPAAYRLSNGGGGLINVAFAQKQRAYALIIHLYLIFQMWVWCGQHFSHCHQLERWTLDISGYPSLLYLLPCDSSSKNDHTDAQMWSTLVLVCFAKLAAIKGQHASFPVSLSICPSDFLDGLIYRQMNWTRHPWSPNNLPNELQLLWTRLWGVFQDTWSVQNHSSLIVCWWFQWWI